MEKTIKIGDKTVNRLGYGAMRITGQGVWGEPADHEGAIAVLRRAVELGVNFIDTADSYGPEVSENLIREALHPYDGLLVATKGGMTRRGPGQWFVDCSSAHLREACEASLRRLGLQQIELYQLHTVDPRVPFVDSLNTLVQLQQEGKIKHIGLSNVTTAQVEQARALTEIVSVQNKYNLLNREHEPVLRFCQQQGIAFIPYFPIGGNTGGLKQQVLETIADKHGVSSRTLGLSWLLRHSPVMVPIPGTSSLEHVAENMSAWAVELEPDEVAQLDALV